MMIRKYILTALAVLPLFIGSCHKDNKPEEGEKKDIVNVEGCWELSSIQTKASIGSVSVEVYLEFKSGSFNLYQKIGEGRFSHFSGTYELKDNKLSGSYSSGKSWGPYTVSMTTTSLSMTPSEGKETDIYKKISSIPSTVLENIY